MNNNTNIIYKGNVDIDFVNEKSNTRIANYHNQGTLYLFKTLCAYLMRGNGDLLPKIGFIQAVKITGGNTDIILKSPINVSTSSVLEGDTASVIAVGSLYWRDIDFSKLADISSSELYLYLMPITSYTDNTISDYALAKVRINSSLFDDIEPGIQATIQWTMTFSSEGDN